MTHSKSRQQAEVAFGRTQSQFFARNQAVEEHETITQARDEKTSRLRAARLEKESNDRATAVTTLVAKRKKPN